ncbi:MAG: ATP-binding cassette domain-containing protein [Prevotella sp.]|nr:ATP-binding cassette domain-containing protein [Prevotella sp.]
MNSIALHHVVPHVFAQHTQLESDIWNNDISFEKGKKYLVLADSGQGKSSLCGFLMGYRRDYDGDIAFDGVNIRQLSVSDWCSVRQQQMAYLFQELRLFPELTARENVEIKNILSASTTNEQIALWFQRLGIEDKMDAKVGHMSFGQQQRVALIRALAQPFDFLLLDEPISHLDDGNAAVMAEVMMEEVERKGAAVIVTSIGKHMMLDYDITYHL